MIYNEQKLESFSRTAFKYETAKIIKTHSAIRKAIRLHFDTSELKKILGTAPTMDIFLQGSYKNDTNVTKSSDVDIVIRLETIWKSNNALQNQSNIELKALFHKFNIQILFALQKSFGSDKITNAHKCLKLKEHSDYCSADVIPCLTYRHYDNNSKFFKDGIYFITNDNQVLINYPKQHYDNLTQKSRQTNGNFKQIVRMFKNIKDDLIERKIINNGTVKSYFIENWLYNTPNTCFTGTYLEQFKKILDWFILCEQNESFRKWICANQIDLVISDKNWRFDNLKQFLAALIKIRNENKF